LSKFSNFTVIFNVFKRYVGCVRPKAEKLMSFRTYVCVCYVANVSRIPKKVVGWGRRM